MLLHIKYYLLENYHHIKYKDHIRYVHNHQQQQLHNLKFILKSRPYDNTTNEMKSNIGLNIFKALRPIIAFYVVMLAPIYGIGFHYGLDQ